MNSGARTNKGISKFGCESTAKNHIKASAFFLGGGMLGLMNFRLCPFKFSNF